jgi:DNA-binding NtrC family response regulator
LRLAGYDSYANNVAAGSTLGRVLVIEDDKGISALTKHHLSTAGFEPYAAFDGAAALQMFPDVKPSAVCLDLGLPDVSGMDLFDQIRRLDIAVPILVLTADDQVATAVRALRAGAYDYLLKPIDRHKLTTSLRAAVGLRQQLDESTKGQEVNGRMVGESPVMMRLFQQIERVGESAISVLLHGESGTGKELVATSIHRQSSRRHSSFVALNCAAIPEALQESQLFGHERGAFTGAIQRSIGCFEQADGGTLFLDEVAELRLDLQAKLLRALQERLFHRVGGQAEVRSDFRIIAASHKDLMKEVKEGRFREDLYFRLAVFEVEVPPLRERGTDIGLLANHFCNHYSKETNKIVNIAPSTMSILERYDWPGNVRELQNAIHRAIVLSTSAQILPNDLPPRLVRPTVTNEVAATTLTAAAVTTLVSEPVCGDLEAAEKRTIVAVLARTAGNMTQAARELGIGRTTLYRKMKKYGLPYPA